jgi:class 3 adenylate cyclase
VSPLSSRGRRGEGCAAGLELVAAVSALKTRALLQTRVGIAKGLVIVGALIGSGASQEQAIVGETLNLAARLQGIAEPNMVVSSRPRANFSAACSSYGTSAQKTWALCGGGQALMLALGELRVDDTTAATRANMVTLANAILAADRQMTLGERRCSLAMPAAPSAITKRAS